MKIIQKISISLEERTSLIVGEGKINLSLLDVANDCGEDEEFAIPYKQPSDFGMGWVDELYFYFMFLRGKPTIFCSATEYINIEEDEVDEEEDEVGENYSIEFDDIEEEQSLINFFLELGATKGYFVG